MVTVLSLQPVLDDMLALSDISLQKATNLLGFLHLRQARDHLTIILRCKPWYSFLGTPLTA